jgi:hypothetical protein
MTLSRKSKSSLKKTAYVNGWECLLKNCVRLANDSLICYLYSIGQKENLFFYTLIKTIRMQIISLFGGIEEFELITSVSLGPIDEAKPKINF